METPQESKSKSLTLSILLHVVLLGLLFFFASREEKEGPSGDPIQIESINDKQASPSTVAPRRKARAYNRQTSKPKPSSHAISLSDLGLRLNTEPVPESSAPTENSRPEPETIPEADGWDTLNPDPKIARFNQYVYNVVQGWLDRDAYMNRQQIYGTVKVKIWFDENGNYLENQTGYEAIDPDFQLIVARALRKAFVRPIPRPYLYLRKKFFIEREVVIRRF